MHYFSFRLLCIKTTILNSATEVNNTSMDTSQSLKKCFDIITEGFLIKTDFIKTPV